MTDLIDTIIPEKIPRHIAIIMDGNGRWANEKGQERLFGHSSGVKSVREAIKTAIELGVSYITLYAFSIENWNRPKQEVDGLMDLLISSIANEIDEFNENGVKLLTIGDINSLPENCMLSIKDAVSRTSENSKLTLILAVNYSSKWEITQAVKTITESVNNNELAITEITENLIQRHLSTNSIPDPELLIRTSGEYRISNFLLMQSANAEYIFLPIMWPDFKKTHLVYCITEYSKRDRRFGMISEQKNTI